MNKGTCIYCKAKDTDLSIEHAFPDSLRQKGMPHWTIDKHICENCNRKFGKELDVVMSDCSIVGFVFDLIQRERGEVKTNGKKSIYHKPKGKVKPIRLLFPNPVYDNFILLHEPARMYNDLNYMNTLAMRPQMILTLCSEGQTYEDVIKVNKREFCTKNFDSNDIVHDEQDDVFCLFNNTYIFPPKRTQYYLSNVDEFKSKYMTDYPQTQYCMRTIYPPEGHGEQKFDDFYKHARAESKEIIKAAKVPPEMFRHPIYAIADKTAELRFTRALAKLAFHCFLHHYKYVYTGHESQFEPIKAFISQGLGSPSEFVMRVRPHQQIEFCVYDNAKHQHIFGFYIKDQDIGCQVDLFTGIVGTDIFSYNIVLSGDPNRNEPDIFHEFTIPFYVHPNSSLKRRIISISPGIIPINPRIVPSSMVGVIRPSQMSDLLYLKRKQ